MRQINRPPFCRYFLVFYMMASRADPRGPNAPRQGVCRRLPDAGCGRGGAANARVMGQPN